MAKLYERIPCGGFRYDTTAFAFKKDPETKELALTLTEHVQTAGAEYVILKSKDSDQLFKVTVDDSGTLKAEKFAGPCP